MHGCPPGACRELPEHIRLIGAKEKVNTYDLMEIGGLGLVYTTTVGMEMAMYGVPVIVAGDTHYRGRGFTYDPPPGNSITACWTACCRIFRETAGGEQVESAWEYAYRFFFEFPRPSPGTWCASGRTMDALAFGACAHRRGLHEYGHTFRYLAGEPLTW